MIEMPLQLNVLAISLHTIENPTNRVIRFKSQGEKVAPFGALLDQLVCFVRCSHAQGQRATTSRGTGGRPLGKVMRPLSGTDAPCSIDLGLFALTD